jgi:hypothetical protein
MFCAPCSNRHPHGTSLSPRVIAGVNKKEQATRETVSISDHMSVRMLCPGSELLPQWTSSQVHDSHEPGFILLPRHYVSNMAATIWHQRHANHVPPPLEIDSCISTGEIFQAMARCLRMQRSHFRGLRLEVQQSSLDSEKLE